MVYERGTASDTFDLFDKLTNFMTTVPGWQIWANIDGYSHRDFVYRSVGTSGKNDIYIRQRVGAPEPFLKGADQYDYGNGDSGFLNFFSYLYFPQDGDAYDGVSEIGSFGPRLVYYNAESSGTRWYWQDLLSQKSGGAAQKIYGTVTAQSDPGDYATDPHCTKRRHWSLITTGPSANGLIVGTRNRWATDSRNYLYVAESETDKVWRYSLARSGGGFDSDGNLISGVELPEPGFEVSFLVYVEDRTTRVPYLYCLGLESTNAIRYNLLNDTKQNISTTTWPSRSGDTTHQESGAICWDGGQYIYMMRGGVSSDIPPKKWPDWARYDILNDTWRTTTDPDDPAFPGFSPTLSSQHQHLLFVNKDVSGFEYNRLYITIDSDSKLYYINLDPYTGLPAAASPNWTLQTYAGRSDHGNVAKMFMTRHKRLLHFKANNSYGAAGIYEVSPRRPDRTAIYADLKETGTTNFYPMGPAYLPDGQSTWVQNELIDGYACKVRTSINNSTEYVFIGNRDRIIVATKSYPDRSASYSATWSVAYMGAFESIYASEPYAELAENVTPGIFKTLRLKNISGQFRENCRYSIIGTSGPQEIYSYHPEGRTRKIGYSEPLSITKASGNTIVASIKNSYNAGAKIGLDPQPVGLFFDSLQKFQVTNVLPKPDSIYRDNTNGCIDPSLQTCSIATSETNLKSSAENAIELENDLPVWKLIFSSGIESEGYHAAEETRGSPIGMYAIGKATGISSEQTISLGEESYLILEIPSYTNKYLLIGPMN